MPKYALYQTVSVGLLFVSVQLKHRNSLFWYRSETTETNYYETNQKKPPLQASITKKERPPAPRLLPIRVRVIPLVYIYSL
jgi:hypothetical protein